MGEWVSVKERLPALGSWVWIYAITTSFDWSQGFFQTSGKLEGVSESGDVYFSTIGAQYPATHWKPLPEPPK